MFANTIYFSEAAEDYRKNNGIYCKAPAGTREFEQYWDIQEERCAKGMSVAGTKITGRHYFYLNFFPIKQVPSKALKEKNKISATVEKIVDFPRFWEIDYEWWWAKRIALRGATKEEVLSLKSRIITPKDYEGGKHIGCLKTRRAGFSYKEAADGVYNYNFIPDSKSYYFAAAEQYLIVDGILNKVQSGLNFLNQETQNVWFKNRMKKNTLMHQRASYIDSNKEEKGYMSEIIGVIVNDPDKVRGKDGIKITYEEAGSFRNLKKALAISRPSVEQGGYTTGQISVFGTGGEEGEDIEGLEDVFSNPEVYNMMEFKNIWETGDGGTCGFFVPCYLTNDKFIDENGNADIEGAKNYENEQRAIASKSKDPKTLDRRVAEHPMVPDEALSRTNNTIFPVQEAKAQLKRILADREIQGRIKHGWITQTDKGVKFRPAEDVKPLDFYPHKNDDDLNGAITIYKKAEEVNGIVPENVYIMLVDPYYKDDAEDKTSLGAAYVLERQTQLTPHGNIIVAKYVARPKNLATFHRNLFLLSEMYNCKIQAEISGGGQGIIDYARMTRQMHKLEYEPVLFDNKEINRNRNRSYFMNTTTEQNKLGLLYFADWLIQPRGINEDGNTILNIHEIYDPGLLYEIIKFKEGRNFDRISAMVLGMYMLKEMHAIEVKQMQEKANNFWDRPKFTDNTNYGNKIKIMNDDMIFNN